ncbi:CHAT domain-containing protein [Sphingobacterium sp. HJSM2_6]|uniref:CHAT domain-containing protein n=1 Tax=Sphingobacterium sp. HJSM2_6 TaxID=3366264 RepID=UPI003BD0DFD7
MLETGKDSIRNSLLDSIGELAYESYPSFKDQPEHFLKAISPIHLEESQQETYLWILINMAYGFQEHSRMVKSSQYYEKALLYDDEQQVLSLEDRLTYIDKPLANNYTIMGDYEKAENLQLNALKGSENANLKASFYNNLAILYFHQGNLLKSKEHAILGLKTEVKSPYLRALLNNSLCDAYVALGHLDSALIYNQQAITLTHQVQMDEPLASARKKSLEQQAYLFMQDSEYKIAQSLLKDAINLQDHYFPNSRIREKASLYNTLGETYSQQLNSKQALHYFKSAEKLIEDNRDLEISNYTKINIYRNLGLFYAKDQIDSALYYFEKLMIADFAFQQNSTRTSSHLLANLWNRTLMNDIFNQLGEVESFDQEKLIKLLWFCELTKGRLLWNEIHRSETWKKDASPIGNVSKQLQQLYAQRDRLSDSLDIQETQEEIERLTDEFELEEQFYAKKKVLPTYEEFRKQLFQSHETAYAYYVHSTEDISIFKLSNAKISYYKRHQSDLLTQISQFKNLYFNDSPQHFNNNPAQYFKQADQLRELLLPDLDQKELLKLSLDNELHILPFDALTLGKEFLIKNYQIQYLPSFVAFQHNNEPQIQDIGINLFYRDQYDAPFNDLPYVRKEVEQINKHFKSTKYPADQLTSNKMAYAWSEPAIIHIAAHTVLDNNQEAKLLLQQPISTDQLRYYGIKTPLVVLSACNTATGKLLPSEGLASLNRAFLSKGIPGVIATHWFANDAVMLTLTEKFYHHLGKEKRPIKALAEAKRAYINEQDLSGQNPWYWANMIYTGADIEIDLHERAGLPKSYWFILAMTFMFIAYMFLKSRFTNLK